MNVSDLPTPSFVVDRATVARNCETMLAKAKASGVVLRPHVKTHKTIEGARLQLGAASGPITVSTLAEAEGFAEGGFDDITYAVPIEPGKFERALGIARRVCRLNVLLDHPATLAALEAFASAHGFTFDVFVKVDCGYHRAGIDPEDRSSVELVRSVVASPRIRFQGLLTHGGHSYHAKSREEILPIAHEETDVLARFAAKLGEAGIRVPVRSVGSTPTAAVVDRFEDCDEVRPGNYVFYDAFQVAIGSCDLSDCAATVVSSVIGIYPERHHALIDAGALALSRDPGPVHVDPSCGFGFVCDLNLNRLPVRLTSLSQEHGWLESDGSLPEGLTIGSKVRIVPNHSCLTAALYDEYAVTDGSSVTAAWRPVRGW